MKVTIEINGETHELDVPDETARALQEIADRNGLTLEAALQQAISNEKFFEEQVANGAKVLVEKDRQLREVEFA